MLDSVMIMDAFSDAFNTIAIVAVLVSLLLILVVYILSGLGLMGIAKKLNIKNGWMAWIPVLDLSLMAKIAFNNLLLEIILPILMIISGRVNISINDKTTYSSVLPEPFGAIALGIFVVLYFVCLHKIYKRMSNKAVIMTIFTILSLGLLSPIFLFVIRKNKVLEEINNTNTTITNGFTNNKEQYFEQPIPQQNAQYNVPEPAPTNVPIQNLQVNNPVEQVNPSVQTSPSQSTNTAQSNVQNNQM